MYADWPYNFGALPPLPAGYSVVYHDCHEHYQAHGPDEWESAITCNPYQARRLCFARAAALPNVDRASLDQALGGGS